jgi:hypothetical protein
MRPTLPVIVGLTLVLAACVPRGTDARSFSNGDCRPIPYPEELPAAAELVDTDELARQVAEVWTWAELDPGDVLLTMAYDDEGLNIRRDVIRHSVTPVAADSVQQLVFASLQEMEEDERPWTVRLRVEGNDGVRFAVERSGVLPAAAARSGVGACDANCTIPRPTSPWRRSNQDCSRSHHDRCERSSDCCPGPNRPAARHPHAAAAPRPSPRVLLRPSPDRRGAHLRHHRDSGADPRHLVLWGRNPTCPAAPMGSGFFARAAKQWWRPAACLPAQRQNI